MTTFNPKDPEQVAAACVLLEVDRSWIVDVLVTECELERDDAIDLVATMVRAHLRVSDMSDGAVADRVAVAAEWGVS